MKCTKSGRTRKSSQSQSGSSMGSVQGNFDKDMLRPAETPLSAHPLEPPSQAFHSRFPISSAASLNRKSLFICTRRECVCV